MKNKGLFITFEGPEGSGKSTQSRRLAAWLRREGHKVLLTREPGGTRIGQRLRSILLDRRNKKIEPFTELCLYEASRALLIQEKIRPALEAGKIVVVDRFQDSTWVYQGFAGGMDQGLVEQMGRFALGRLKPDLTLLLDLPAKQGLKRVRHPNRFEAKALSFHEKVRQGYGVLKRREPKRIRVISALESIQQVQAAIRKEVSRVLK